MPIILVAIVVLVFLQGWRAAIIPLIAVPVAIIGTFAAMAVAGFSLNTLTLFGLVLAIGIVVDDAIVVVEAVEHHIERGLARPGGGHPGHGGSRRPGCGRGPGAERGVRTLRVHLGYRRPVLPAIRPDDCHFDDHFDFQFPDAQPGAGRPAVAAKAAKRDPLTWLIDFTLGWFFRLFNHAFRTSTWHLYRRCRPVAARAGLGGDVYGGLLLLTYWGFLQLPTGFIPSQDKGYLLASVQLPDAAAADSHPRRDCPHRTDRH